MKLLSYSFFEPKSMPQHRSWDKYKNEIDRYYYNVPAVVLTNYLLYPDYTIQIYMTPNVRENPLSKVFDILGEYNLNINVVHIDYEFTEPSIFRMIPLWRDDVSVFHTRDIDSLPTLVEYQYIKCFEKHDKGVGTIRTHPTHYGGGCRMLAGLSSFKPRLVPDYIKSETFMDYFDRNHGRYGCDQDLMVQTFTTDHSYTKRHFCDCMSYEQHNTQDFPCYTCSLEELSSIEIINWPLRIFQKIEQCGFNNWSGEPIDCRGTYLDFILEIFPSICANMQQDIHLRDFYKVG